MPELNALTISTNSIPASSAIGSRPITVGGASLPLPTGPQAQNRLFTAFGDSRAEDAQAYDGLKLSGFMSYLLAMCPQIHVKDPGFGIGGQNTSQMLEAGRTRGGAPGDRSIAALNALGSDNIVIIAGTNDGTLSATSPTATRIQQIVDGFADRVVFLLDEFPRGRTENHTNASTSPSPAGMREYAAENRKLAWNSGDAKARAHVCTAANYESQLNTTTLNNLDEVSHDGLHPNDIGGWLAAKALATQVDAVHDRSVDFARLPSAANPMAPTSAEFAPYGNGNPFLLGSDGSTFNITHTGAPMPDGFWLAGSDDLGTNITAAVSYGVDQDGYRQLIIRFTGTQGSATGPFGAIRIFNTQSAASMASRGFVPGDTIRTTGRIVIDGHRGVLLQSIGGRNAETNLGLRHNVGGGPDILPASAYTTPLPFRTVDVPTPPGTAWQTGSNLLDNPIGVLIQKNVANDGLPIDFTVKISRLGLVKIA